MSGIEHGVGSSAREIARAAFCSRGVDGIPVKHGHRGPIARRTDGGLCEVGYSWSRWGAHHLSGTVYERILGRGRTWEAAFAAADRRLASAAAREIARRARP
jgi:hypothetical protein